METAKITQIRHFGVIMLIPGLGGRVYAHFLAMEWFWLYSALKMGGHDAFPNPFKKYDETTLQLCITRPPSGVGHAAKISRKKSNSKIFDLKRNPELG